MLLLLLLLLLLLCFLFPIFPRLLFLLFLLLFLLILFIFFVLLLSLHVQRLLTRHFRSRTDPFTREPLVMGQVRQLMLLQCGCFVAKWFKWCL
jgi:hypothetical protein